MRSFGMASKQVAASGFVVGLVLGAQELFKALAGKSLAGGGGWGTAFVVVTSGVVASLLCSLFLWALNRRSSEQALVGTWRLLLGDAEGKNYREAEVTIKYEGFKLRLQGTNKDVNSGLNASQWNSTAAWISEGKLFFLYDLQQTTNQRLRKSGFMVLNIDRAKEANEMNGNWFDYQPAGREGLANWRRTA